MREGGIFGKLFHHGSNVETAGKQTPEKEKGLTEADNVFNKLKELSKEKGKDLAVQVPVDWIHKNEDNEWVFTVNGKDWSVGGTEVAGEDSPEHFPPRFMVVRQGASEPDIYPNEAINSEVVDIGQLLTNTTEAQNN